jgi:hypothetical protein
MMKEVIEALAMPVGIVILWILASMADNNINHHVARMQSGIEDQHPDCIRATE